MTGSHSPFGPGWFLVKDWAEITGQSPKTVRREVGRGQLEGRREGDKPNGRLWVWPRPEVSSQPTVQLAAATLEIRELVRKLEAAEAWGSEQARLRVDAERRAEDSTQARRNAGADARIAAARHNSDLTRLQEDNDFLRQEIQDWERHSAALEEERDDAEEALDRYRDLYEVAEKNVSALRDAAQRHDSVVSTYAQQDRKQSAEIRRLQGEIKRLEAEPARLRVQISEKIGHIRFWENETLRLGSSAKFLIPLTAVAGALACIFSLVLYLAIRVPAALTLLVS